MFLTFSGVSFAYPNAFTTLFNDLSLTIPPGWTGIIGANGQGKTTLMRLATGDLSPDNGSITIPGDSLYCAQATEGPPALLDEFSQDWGADASRLRSILRIDDDWPWRFDSLSHGERKRLQLAVALWRRPYVLALDEPTNHLDLETRAWVSRALRDFDGIGLLVSHDRQLLDSLVDRCVAFAHGGVVLRPGNYSDVDEQLGHERRSVQHERDRAKRELRQLTEEASRRRTEADRADTLRSKQRVDSRDHDAKARIGLAIVTGKDGKAGRLSSQMEARLMRARGRLSELKVDKDHRSDVWFEGAYSTREILAEFGPGHIALGQTRVLQIPHLIVGAQDRIALVGRNGAGKSTLLAVLLDSLKLERERVLSLPQELTESEAACEIKALLGMDDASQGRLLTAVARLGSQPSRLLDGVTPSPGELRKLMIARGTLAEPHLLVMDEPTNHMDLSATIALEEALADYPGALVLVSHDARFVERLTTTMWEVRMLDDGNSQLRVL